MRGDLCVVLWYQHGDECGEDKVLVTLGPEGVLGWWSEGKRKWRPDRELWRVAMLQQAPGCSGKKNAEFYTHLLLWDLMSWFFFLPWICQVPVIYKKGCSAILASSFICQQLLMTGKDKPVPSPSVSSLRTAIYYFLSFSDQPWEESWILHHHLFTEWSF